MQERIQKILAQAGVCSRRAAEQMIEEGRVTVNGRRAKLGDRANGRLDRICVDRRPIKKAEEKVYIMLHKPRGFVTTMKDERGRKDVSQLVRDCKTRVYPVGRLDVSSEGLLLMTNDGELAHKLMHPRHEITKKYRVSIRGDLKRLDELAQPMEIDGYQLQPAQVSLIQKDEDEGNQAVIRMIIHEGRNRQIRKMCEKCGFEVKRLKREAIGKLELDRRLPAGKWRMLTERELTYLMNISPEEIEAE